MRVENIKKNDHPYIIKDTLQGDDSLAGSPLVQSLSYKEIQEALNLILGQSGISDTEKQMLMNNLWLINYHTKPPKPSEFLTPKYIGPMADSIFPHVRSTFEEFLNPQHNKRLLALSTSIGFGKAQDLDSIVHTATGPKKMRDIELGDKLVHPHNKESYVIAIHPQGVKDIYEITFRDGDKVRCCEDHLWKVSSSWDSKKSENGKCCRSFNVKPLKEFKDKNLKNKHNSLTHYIPYTQPVEYKEVPHIIHPYNLGVLIGDGSLKGSFSITSHPEDTEVIDHFRENLPDYIVLKKTNTDKYGYSILDPESKSQVLRHRYKEEVERLKLNTTSLSKFIPKEYLYDSINNRVSLLQGLMDTDGWSEKNGHAFFSSSSKRLADDVASLVKSLGGKVSRWNRVPTGQRIDGSSYARHYTLHIQVPSDIKLFQLKRKQERVDRRSSKRKSALYKGIVSIEKVGQMEAQCITVSADDGLYLTDNYIVTHNSSLSVIIMFYIMVCLSYMRNPKKYFGLGEMGSLVMVFISFTQSKSAQLLLQPLINLVKGSPIMHGVKMEDRLKTKQAELDKGHIAFTTAGRMGSLQLPIDLHVTTVSDRLNLLGLNIVAGVLSEASFYIKSRGLDPDEAWGILTDLRERIKSRMQNAYYTCTILDSSPLDLELSPFDKWLYSGEALKDPEVMLVQATHWDLYKDIKVDMYKEFNKTGKTFPVFRGDSSRPPKIIEKNEYDNYPDKEIVPVPIDLKIDAERNLQAFVRNMIGYPSGGLSKLFDTDNFIHNIFTPSLRNQYDPINIPEEKDPKRLIWNQIVNKFFTPTGDGYYQFYRSPRAKRAIHIDLSETGDISSLTMSHKELSLKGEEIIIHDFNLPLHKGNSRINIDAVCEFVLDLKKLGRINILKVTADQYQSATILQRMRREGIEAEKLSVDRETGPYLLYASYVKQGRVKAGKSIHLKNNLKSLVETQRDKSGSVKIDHIQGTPIYEDSGTWNTSQVGYRAKDVSDPACGSVFILLNEYKKTPIYTFDDTVNLEDHKVKRAKVLNNILDDYILKPRVKD